MGCWVHEYTKGHKKRSKFGMKSLYTKFYCPIKSSKIYFNVLRLTTKLENSLSRCLHCILRSYRMLFFSFPGVHSLSCSDKPSYESGSNSSDNSSQEPNHPTSLPSTASTFTIKIPAAGTSPYTKNTHLDSKSLEDRKNYDSFYVLTSL